MKKSDEWVDQDMVDQKCNQAMAERGCTSDQVKPPWIAEKLGMSKAGGHLYNQVRDWRRRMQSSDRPYLAELPADAAMDIRRITIDMAEGMINVAKRIVRDHGDVIEQTASRRIADAERRQNEAEAELAYIASAWEETEQALAASEKQVASISGKLAQASTREERLHGRIDQLIEGYGQRRHQLTTQDVVAAAAPVVATNPAPSLRNGDQVMEQRIPSMPVPATVATDVAGNVLAKPDGEGHSE